MYMYIGADRNMEKMAATYNPYINKELRIFLARVSRVIGNTYSPNFMVLDHILIEKWAKNWFLTFDP